MPHWKFVELSLDLKQLESFVNYCQGEKPRGVIDTQTVQYYDYAKLAPSNMRCKGKKIYIWTCLSIKKKKKKFFKFQTPSETPQNQKSPQSTQPKTVNVILWTVSWSYLNTLLYYHKHDLTIWFFGNTLIFILLAGCLSAVLLLFQK